MCDMCYNELRKQVIIFQRKWVTNYNELCHCRTSLYAKYYPLHEASVENGVDKLRKIYQIGVTKGRTNDKNSDI